MNTNWNEGYRSEIEYKSYYFPEIQPNSSHFMQILSGVKPLSESKNSVHCELGMGQGISIVANAATSEAQFIGVDFMPNHVLNAQEMADELNLKNIRLLENSFEQFLQRDDIPPLDSISLHGVWSWINTKNQDIILKIIDKFLKSGGYVYISYNCLPGWRSELNEVNLMRLSDKYLQNKRTDLFTRAKNSIEFLKMFNKIAEQSINRDKNNIKNFLNSIENKDSAYLVHEYLNENWSVPKFEEVAENFANIKLDYVTEILNMKEIDEFSLEPSAIEFLDQLGNPILREQVRDYLIDRNFRRDYYIKGKRQLTVEQQFEELKQFNVLAITQTLPTSIKTMRGPLEINFKVYRKVFDYLISENAKPKSIASLYHLLEPGYEKQDFIIFIRYLTVMGIILPCFTTPQMETNLKNLKDYNLKQLQRIDNAYIRIVHPYTGYVLNDVPLEARMFLLADFEEKGNIQKIVKNFQAQLKSHNLVINKDEEDKNLPEAEIIEKRYIYNQSFPAFINIKNLLQNYY